ncbi:MAG TPA: hypothetical protein VGB46_05955 [Flavisolibacter sp.]|jgi:hypothetical protein
MRFRNLPLALVLALSGIAMLISCQREFDPKIPGGPISSKDPASLSAAIKVWHGVRTQGTMPSPAGSSLQLNPSTGPVRAFAGRYAIIQPEVLSGNVQGYYVKLNGAPEYFKVDYSKPRDINGRTRRPADFRDRNPLLNGRVDSSGNGGNVDSALVIVLPQNIQVPDTFCISYCAYDSVGNISQPVSVCIIVSSLGGDASSGWMNGTWKITAEWDDTFHDTVVHDKWMAAASEYYCIYDSATNASYLLPFNNGVGPLVAADSVRYDKYDLVFSSNGAQQFVYEMNAKMVETSTSTCQQVNYEMMPTESDQMIGAWSYNSTTKKITIIFEFDDMGTPIVEAWEYDVVKVTDSHMILVDNFDPSWPYYIRLQK